MNTENTENAVSTKPPFRLPRMNPHADKNPNAEHRQAQRQRTEEAASLAQTYPHLKSLKVNLEFVNREGITKTNQMKYSANPEHAKSVLVFACPTSDCLGGDFDLTAKLAEAVVARKTRASGKLCCQGRHKRPSGVVEPCLSELRYNLNLAYSKPA